MSNAFITSTVDDVLGYAEIGERSVERTPLNGVFRPDFFGSIVPLDLLEMLDERAFNAVGSLAVPQQGDNKLHLPVIDANGGARKVAPDNDSELIIWSLGSGVSGPTDELVEILGDYGIEARIIPSQTGRQIGGIVLSFAENDRFAIYPSSSEGHDHVYIQLPFTDGDHSRLITELGVVGIVSEDWAEMTDRVGMGVIRTPWTKKQPNE